MNDIIESLPDIRKKLENKNKKNPEILEKLRSVEEATKVLKLLKNIVDTLDQEIEKNSYVESLFSKKYIKYEVLNDADFLQKSAFIYDELFPYNDYYVLSLDGSFQNDLIESYHEHFKSWIVNINKTHDETQLYLKSVTGEIDYEKVECRCQDCVGLIRTKICANFDKKQEKTLNQLEEDLFEMIITKKIDVISDKVTRVKRNLERELKNVRFRLRRSTYNGLYTGIKEQLERRLSLANETQVAKTYSEKVKSFLRTEISNVKADFFTDEEFEKFFKRLRLNLWRPSSYLKREFIKHSSSLITLKRKDISSTILRNYLGQFWLYSPARRKKRIITYHMGPTNSGKTYHALQALAASSKGSYLAPLRLLASEIFDTLEDKGVTTTLLTGEEVIERPNSTHYSSTIEMAKLSEEFECVVIDEIQMIGDSQRGWAWTRALIHMNSDHIHLCGDSSALPLVEEILKLTGDELVIKQYERMTKLQVEPNALTLKDLTKGDALIVFSRRNALKHKIELEKLGHKVSIVYGMLNPDVRREQARRFDEGETDIIVSTDAISMGMNLPVRRIVFTSFSKFINSREHPLTDSEVKQIAGRAGRYKRFPTGYATYIKHQRNEGKENRLHEALNCELVDKEVAMLGPDLDLFLNVNKALEENKLNQLSYSEFLRLFYTMEFSKPFFCVRLDEMIEVSEMVEEIDSNNNSLTPEEVFGFSCAPVNLGNVDHVQYFYNIVSRYSSGQDIINEMIDVTSNSIDYLETAIKCLELYQWLARHFQDKYFSFDKGDLTRNKMDAVEKLNTLLSEKTIKYYDPYKFQRKPRRDSRSKDKSKSRRSNGDKKKFGKNESKFNRKKSSSRKKTRR